MVRHRISENLPSPQGSSSWFAVYPGLELVGLVHLHTLEADTAAALRSGRIEDAGAPRPDIGPQPGLHTDV